MSKKLVTFYSGDSLRNMMQFMRCDIENNGIAAGDICPLLNIPSTTPEDIRHRDWRRLSMHSNDARFHAMSQQSIF